MALFTGVQHLCTFKMVASLIYHLLPILWKASYTFSTAIFVTVPYWLPYNTDKFIFCVVPGPSQWFFYFGEEIVIVWAHIGRVRWMFQNLPLQPAQEVHDSSSVTPCNVMKNDGVLYHQVSSFSPESTKPTWSDRDVNLGPPVVVRVRLTACATETPEKIWTLNNILRWTILKCGGRRKTKNKKNLLVIFAKLP